MRIRNNIQNKRHTVWTEHFTIRSYLKDYSEFNQGSQREYHQIVHFAYERDLSNRKFLCFEIIRIVQFSSHSIPFKKITHIVHFRAKSVLFL